MAGRIPQTFINDLLDRVDLVAFMGERLPLKRRGANHWACCPFHEEKTPSFSISTEGQFYKCFGCGVSGTALTFLVEHDHLDFVSAVETLAERVGVAVVREGGETPQVDRHREGILATLDAAATYFRRCLADERGRAARQYLAGRELTPETIERFGIGYAPAGWQGLATALPNIEQSLLEKAGLIAVGERGAYDRFRGRVMFPIRNARGRVIAFGGRVISDGEPKYLNSPETSVFHKGRELFGLFEGRRAARTLPHLVLVEGYLDVVSLSQHGVHEAVAALGTATTKDQIEALFKANSDLICCFDGDAAGRKAAWRMVENALPGLVDARQLAFLFLAEGEDPDSLVRRGGRVAWDAALQRKVSFADYFFDHLAEGLDLQQLDDRTALAQRAEPLLAQLPGGVRVRLMRDRLRSLIGLSGGARSNVRPTNAWNPVRRRQSAPVSGRRPGMAQQALAWLLRAPALAVGVDEKCVAQLRGVDEPGAQAVVDVLMFLRERSDAAQAEILGHFNAHEARDALFAAARMEQLLGIEEGAQELRSALLRIIADHERGSLKRKTVLVGEFWNEGDTDAAMRAIEDRERARASNSESDFNSSI